MAEAINNIELGYGGGAIIDGHSVLITSGSLNRSRSVPYINPYSMPLNNEQRQKLVQGLGTYTFSGSIGFDMTLGSVDGLVTEQFLKRNHEFEITIDDGYKQYSLTNCKWDSFSISVSPNALVSGSLGFQSIVDFEESSKPIDYIFDLNNNPLLQYWHTGESDVESFTLSFSQSLTPVHLNANADSAINSLPQYIRGGNLEVSLEINAFEEWLEHQEVAIGPKRLSIREGVRENENYNYGGQNETGSHSYIFKSHGVVDSADEVFRII